MKKWNIFIDFDDTLHDTKSIFASKLEGILGMDGKTLYHMYLFDIHRKIIHNQFPSRHNDTIFHLKLLFNHLNKPIDDYIIEAIDLRFKEADRTIFENPKFFKDVPKFLNRVADGGHRLCLSTGGGNSIAKAKLVTRFLGRDYFDKVLGEEILGYLKDNPSYYKEALKRLSWKKKSAISIGDSINTDIYPAKIVGIKTVWVDRNNFNKDLAFEKTPWHTVNNLIAAMDFVESEF